MKYFMQFLISNLNNILAFLRFIIILSSHTYTRNDAKIFNFFFSFALSIAILSLLAAACQRSKLLQCTKSPLWM